MESETIYPATGLSSSNFVALGTLEYAGNFELPYDITIDTHGDNLGSGMNPAFVSSFVTDFMGKTISGTYSVGNMNNFVANISTGTIQGTVLSMVNSRGYKDNNLLLTSFPNHYWVINSIQEINDINGNYSMSFWSWGIKNSLTANPGSIASTIWKIWIIKSRKRLANVK